MRRHPKAALAIAVVLLCLLGLPAAAAADTLPTVSGETASEVGVTTVKLTGEVNPNGASGDGNTTWRLQYSPAGQGAWTTVNEAAIEPPASEEANPVPVEAVFGFGGELSPGKTYEFRLQAENGAGLVETPAAPYPHFTMDAPNPPALVAEAASAESITSAHLKGTVDPEGGNVNPFGPEVMPIFWELQTSTDGSSWTTRGSGEITGAEAEGSAPITVEADATGLAAGTEYQVRLHTNSTNFGSFNLEADSPGPNPTFTTDPATAPTLTFDPPSAPTSNSVHLAGTVDPEGGNVDALQGTLPIRWELQVNPDNSSWSTAGSGELTGSAAEGTDPVSVEADPKNLVPNTNYEARLLVTYAGLQKSSAEEPFATESLGPEISRETLWEPSPTSIQLNAKVNPHNAVLTDCHFVFGSGGNLDQSAPCEAPVPGNSYTAPSGEGNVVVSARVSGLTPATEYGFKLIATNATGSAEGDTRTFTTQLGAASESCPNESVRVEQGSTHLPECRAYEMVSPLDKGNGDIVAEGETTLSSADGNGVVFDSRTPFGDTIGAALSGHTQYLARRGSDGWSTHPITPTPRPDAVQVFLGRTTMWAYSDDLSHSVVAGYDLPGGGGITNRMNLYLEDTETRGLRPVTQTQYDKLGQFELQQIYNTGVSADARHITFNSPSRLLEDAVAGKPNVYQWNDGTLTLASILPDGTPASDGAAAYPLDYRQSMSVDGSKQLFVSPVKGIAPPNAVLRDDSQLYSRIEGERTIWISEPEGSDQSLPQKVGLHSASPDGNHLVFSSFSRLLDEDTNDGPDLYRFDYGPNPDQEQNLTLITTQGLSPAPGIEDWNPFGRTGVMGMAADGTTVYHMLFAGQVFVWRNGVSQQITEASGEAIYTATESASRPGYSRVTPDGQHFVLFSQMNLTGRTDHLAAYAYDFANDTLDCVSCPEDEEARDGATVDPLVTAANPPIYLIAHRPRYLFPDGRTVFSTADALVPEDVNQTRDTYLYDPTTGVVSLLSTGRGRDKAGFADASASGNDIFFLTRQRLDGHDTDNLVDLYDVRVGGGYVQPKPPSAPCSGEQCQGGSTGSSGAPEVSSTVGTRGNVKQPRKPPHRCGKKNQRVKACNRKKGKGKGKRREGRQSLTGAPR